MFSSLIIFTAERQLYTYNVFVINGSSVRRNLSDVSLILKKPNGSHCILSAKKIPQNYQLFSKKEKNAISENWAGKYPQPLVSEGPHDLEFLDFTMDSYVFLVHLRNIWCAMKFSKLNFRKSSAM